MKRASNLNAKGVHERDRQAVEAMLCALWADILQVPKVGADESFLALGGDSLLAVKTISKVEQAYGVSLTPEVFFAVPTVRQLAEAIIANSPTP